MNIFKEMLLSIYDFKSYGGFLRNRKGKVFCFGLLLMLLYFILTWILPFARFHSITGGFVRLVREYVPDFKLENGRLWLEESFEYDYMGTYIYIDTNEDYQLGEGEELMSGENAAYSNILLMNSQKMLMKNEGEIASMLYSDLGLEFSKENLMGLASTYYLVLILLMVFGCLWIILLFFFGVLFVALIGMVVAALMNYNLTFGELYQLGIYARTLPLLIKGVLKLFSLTIPYFFLINFGISVVWIALAIKEMKKKPLDSIHAID